MSKRKLLICICMGCLVVIKTKLRQGAGGSVHPVGLCASGLLQNLKIVHINLSHQGLPECRPDYCAWNNRICSCFSAKLQSKATSLCYLGLLFCPEFSLSGSTCSQAVALPTSSMCIRWLVWRLKMGRILISAEEDDFRCSFIRMPVCWDQVLMNLPLAWSDLDGKVLWLVQFWSLLMWLFSEVLRGQDKVLNSFN